MLASLHLVLGVKEAATAGVILREWGWLALPPLPAHVGGRFRLGREETEYWESADRVVSGRQSDGLRKKSPGLQLLHRRRTSFPTDRPRMRARGRTWARGKEGRSRRWLPPGNPGARGKLTGCSCPEHTQGFA